MNYITVRVCNQRSSPMHELKYADARERYSLNPDISSMYEKNNSRVKLRTHRSAAHLIRSIILPPFQNTRHR
jgi:hypothetical protein